MDQRRERPGPTRGAREVKSDDTDYNPQMPRMPWYPRDHASATRGWPLVADCIYRRLLDAQWDMGSLPSSEAELRAIAGATPIEWRRSWPRIEPKLPICEDGSRRNPRLEQHRAEALARHRQAHEAICTRWERQRKEASHDA